jgi:hypothetical protein
VVLELRQKATADAEAAGIGRHPHALDVEGHVALDLEGTTADRLVVQARDQQQPGGLGELLGGRRDRPLRIEAGVELRVQLGVIGLQAEARYDAAGVFHSHFDEPGGQQALDDAHRLHQP